MCWTLGWHVSQVDRVACRLVVIDADSLSGTSSRIFAVTVVFKLQAAFTWVASIGSDTQLMKAF